MWVFVHVLHDIITPLDFVLVCVCLCVTAAIAQFSILAHEQLTFQTYSQTVLYHGTSALENWRIFQVIEGECACGWETEGTSMGRGCQRWSMWVCVGSQRLQSREAEVWVVGFQEDSLSLPVLYILYVSGMIYLMARAWVRECLHVWVLCVCLCVREFQLKVQ